MCYFVFATDEFICGSSDRQKRPNLASVCRLSARRLADVVKADTIVLGAPVASAAKRRDEADPRRYSIRCWAAG